MAGGNLGLSSITEGHVACQAQIVRDVCILFRYIHGPGLMDSQPPSRNSFLGDSITYKLIVTAHATSTGGVPDRLLQSPCAVLDVYAHNASEDAEYAPEWMRWSESSVFFLHQISSFTDLFIQLADSKFNLDQVCDFII
jgi:hypothetical protein